MGSFATSLHVKSDNARTVADAIRQALTSEGYDATDDAPAEGGRVPSSLPPLHVSDAREGWVSLLDSDGIMSLTLAAALSDRLQTHAIQFFVNDSDSWHYQLYYAGRQLDDFDSCGAEDDEDEGVPADATDSLAGVNAADAQQALMERTVQWQQQLAQRLPAELRELQHKWRTTGQVTVEEMQKYNQWMRGEMPSIVEEMKSVLRGMPGGSSSPRPQPSAMDESPAREDLQAHVEHLRPLLKSGVQEKTVRRVLAKQATFAEQTLGEFLPLLGLASSYANLSYPYLEEYTEQDLARDSIHLAEHLTFKKPTASGKGRPRIVH